jgi:hypothetical protein
MEEIYLKYIKLSSHLKPQHMKYYIPLLIISIFTASCKQTNDLNDLVVINEKGIQENSKDTLSIEDVLKLQNASENPTWSYTAIITSAMEKSYPFSIDSGKTVKCIVRSDNGKAVVALYKLMTRSIKLDSINTSTTTDFTKIQEGDSASDLAKKSAKYKAVVRMKNKLGGDSTIKFTLNVFVN